MTLLFINYGSCKFIWKVWVSRLKKYLRILSFLWFDLSTWMSPLSVLVSVLTSDDTSSLSEMYRTVQRWTVQPSSVMGKAWDLHKGRCHGRGGFRQRSSDRVNRRLQRWQNLPYVLRWGNLSLKDVVVPFNCPTDRSAFYLIRMCFLGVL